MSNQRAIDILQAIRNGAFVAELDNALEAAVAAQQEHGRKASVTVTFTIEGLKEATDKTMVSIGATVTKKLPGRDAFRQILFTTTDGTLLSVRDPRQPDMFAPRAVPPVVEEQPAAERQAPGGTG